MSVRPSFTSLDALLGTRGNAGGKVDYESDFYSGVHASMQRDACKTDVEARDNPDPAYQAELPHPFLLLIRLEVTLYH